MKRYFVLFTLIFINLFFIFSFFSADIYAVTDYIDPDGDGSNANGNWSSTGTYFYTEIDDGVREPNTPTTSDYISSRFVDVGELFLRMSTISSVDTVSQIDVWVYHNDGANGELFVQLYDDDESTTRSSRAAFTQSSTDAWHSVTFSGLSLTQAQLDSLSIALDVDRFSGGPPNDVVVYAMYAEVTYTETASVAISITTDGSVEFGYQPLDTTIDSTASGVDDVQTISVDSGPADLDVESTNFSDGTNTWSLSTSNGADQVVWDFSNDGSTWTTFAQANTLYTFDTNVSEGATRDIYFRLTMPTSTSSYNQHSSTVTVTATAP